VISGAGGLISNAKDMVRGSFLCTSFLLLNLHQAIWLQTLLSEGRNPVDGETVIQDEVIRQVASGVTVAIPVA
jgi:hypothetical protein